jgi:hypothetical protein
MRLLRRPPAPIPAPPPIPPAAPEEPIELGRAARAAANRAVVATIGQELATLASGIEGRAHQLIEAAPERRQLPAAAEALIKSVQRLRVLHRKIVAFSGDGGPTPGFVELATAAKRLAEELQEMQFGIELHFDPPGSLPPLAVAPEVLVDVLSFLAAAMMRAEPGATRLTLVAERLLGTKHEVALELSLEWAGEHHPSTAAGDHQPIDFDAAANLVRAQGGAIELTHSPGRFVRSLVTLPAAESTRPAASTADEDHSPEPVEVAESPADAAASAPPPAAVADPELPPIPPPKHGFGGALLLEPDPTVRAMVARELKAAGRAVFACADSASARAFLETTPERFELLVVDHSRRLGASEALTTTIRAIAPDLRIFLLDRQGAELGSFAAVHSLPKPFGVHELREALALALGPR